MSTTASQFQSKTEEKSFDASHRQKIKFNIGKYDVAVTKGLPQFANLEAARKKAHLIKWKTIENLDRYLLEFESNFIRKGGKVIWANTVEEAQKEILAILKKHETKMLVKSKSMACEEIEINEFLAANKIDSIETDLGEYIVQLLGQKPYHIVTPAMHLSKEDIAKLFHEKFGTPLDASPEALTLKARELLRAKYTTATAGITGANFLIADTGSISITENEGNARLSTTFPKVHIAVVGIEKIIPSIKDLDLFWPLLSTRGTGQQMTVYNSIINGPKKLGESDGPEEMYVVLLDNGRSNLLAQKDQRQALYCIRCGACLNACPVYKNIGGHSYDTTYSGPIGSIITPHLKGMEEFNHLSYASTLCGNCSEVCPVKIDIHKVLLYNRRDAVAQHIYPKSEKIAWFFWKQSMLHRKLIDLFTGKWKSYFVSKLFAQSWGKRRALPIFEEQSFAQLWRAKTNPKKK
jgi:L-lactate dehydrogenase complex protein LldF